LICIGILILRAVNTIPSTSRATNSYLISWNWLNSLFVGTDPVGGIIILFALFSGTTYLFWLWWDPFFVRMPHQKGSSWLYYNWEEGLESSIDSDSEKKS